MPNILHLVHGIWGYGGLESFLNTLTEGLNEHRHYLAAMRGTYNCIIKNIQKVLPIHSFLKFHELIIENKIDFVHIHYTGSESLNNNGFVLLTNSPDYQYLYKDECARTHDDHPFGYMYINQLLKSEDINIPVIATGHAGFRLPTSISSNTLNHFISVSDTAYKVQSHLKLNHSVIYNSVDTEVFKPIYKNYTGEFKRLITNEYGNTKKDTTHENTPKDYKKLIITWVGRLNKYDRDFYNSLKDDYKDRKDVEFWFLGDYSDKNNKVFDVNTPENFKFLGVQDPLSYLQKTDIFLYPTTLDSFSISTLEAMSCGLPVIASKIVSEVVGDTGFIYTNYDDAKEKLELLISRLYLRIYKGMRARKRACEEFSKEKMINRYKDLYDKYMKVAV